MTYQPKHTHGGFDWAADMQRRIDADTASTPRVERLRATITDIERKHGKAPASVPKPTPHEPGPKTRKAMQLAEALRQARRGNVGQALGAEVHKLPVHIVRG